MHVNTYLNEREKAVLESAVIGIAGAGGLGSNCAVHLVRSGIRRLVIADFDTVAESNLNRQFFFRNQIGLPKVRALADNLRAIDPDLELDLHECRLEEHNMTQIFAPCTIVAECFDNPDSKMALVRLMTRAGKNVVAASGIAGWGRSNEIRLRKAGSACYLVGDFVSGISDSMPPFSARVGIAAAMQANTILSILLGTEP